MTIRQLRYFVTAVECGSFTLAARRLYTSQPSFSKQIAMLEEELGFRLFFREHRSVSLTAPGQVYYQAVKDIPDRLDCAVEVAAGTAHTEANTLNIGILEGHLIDPVLSSLLTELTDRCPDVSPVLSRHDFSALHAGLTNHSLDVVFSILFPLKQDTGIASRILYHQTPYIAVNVRNPLAELPAVTFDLLKEQSFVVLDRAASPISYANLTSRLRALGVKDRQLHFAHSTEAVFTGVEAGQGIAIVDGSNRLCQSSLVRLVPLTDGVNDPDFGAAWLAGNEKPALLAFLELVRRVGDTRQDCR